ncbi:Bug family tripartite tricarboxylate transporter substrate binding protein [Chloroflexota bacterium]
MKRTLVLAGTALLLLLLILPLVAGCSAGEKKFPSKSIEWIIPFSAGGGFDVFSRAVGTEMMKDLPKEAPIVFNNVTGAAGVIAITQIYNAEPDGYTIGIMNLPGHATSQYYGEVKYDLGKCSYIGTLNADYFCIYVSKDSPYKTIEDLQKADGLRFAGTGFGDPTQIYGLLLAKEAGIKIDGWVQYKAAPEAFLGMMRGEVDVFNMTASHILTQKENTRVLAIYSDKRNEMFPDIPTIGDVGLPQLAGLGVTRVVFGPPGIPAERVKTLEDVFLKAATSETVTKWAADAKRSMDGTTNAAEARNIVEYNMELCKKYEDVLRPELSK